MIQLINGDCKEEIYNILRGEGNEYVIVTDPPFNIGYHYGAYKDKMKQDDYYAMLKSILTIKNIPFVVIHYPENINRLSIELGIAPERVVSWVYNSNTRRQHRDIAFYKVTPDFSKVKQPYKNPTDKRIAKRIADGSEGTNIYDWWNVNQVKNVSKEKTEHPCQMPLDVMEKVIRILPEGITVIDPFMGSGTTGVACKKVGVNFVGIEIDKKYYDISKNRIEVC